MFRKINRLGALVQISKGILLTGLAWLCWGAIPVAEPTAGQLRPNLPVPAQQPLADAIGLGQLVVVDAGGRLVSKHPVVSSPTADGSADAIATSVRLSSRATLRPTAVMKAYEFEIGVEIGSRAFWADTAYRGNLELAQKIAKTTVRNLDKRYLHSTGIKYRLGTVLIRQTAAEDPLRDAVTATGGGAGRSLSAFRDYWNNNPEIVGTTHDLACYHTYYAPSGLAYVNSVGSRNRYATVGGRGATSWADGTLCHEFGHSWGLRHTGDSGFFYESKPRSNRGATSAGGKLKRMSVMVGDAGNIGHLASDEAEKVLSVLQSKIRFGEPYTPGPVKPFGKRDEVNLTNNSIVIDVIENDYDVNNDVLDAAVFDTVSYRGGKVLLSGGTGPGGRNEIKYVAPPGGLGQNDDWFHYTVFDTSGRKDFGAVYVHGTGAVTVDLTQSKYNYDFGTADSPVLKGFTRISPGTSGDIHWTGSVLAIDRSGGKQVNAVNRDFVTAKAARTLRHRIANGRWKVVLNMGDLQSARDRMGVRAEGKVITRKINSAAGKFPYIDRQGDSDAPTDFVVEIKDQWLDLQFFDNGGKDKNWAVTRLSLTKIPPEKPTD